MNAKIYQTTAGLLGESISSFQAQGWTVLPGFFGAAEAAALQCHTEELAAMPERSGAQMLYREDSLLEGGSRVIQRIENFCPFHDVFDQLIRRGRLIKVASELLGAELTLFKDKINFKAVGGGGFEAHQDQQAGWSRYAPLFVTAMVSIDEATVENGCLEIAAMPRLSGLLGVEWKTLTQVELAHVDFVPVPTQPGDVVFFDSFVVHRSQPNLSVRGRRVLYVTYNPTSDGDHRSRYYADKRASYPPDIDREPGVTYRFRV